MNAIPNQFTEILEQVVQSGFSYMTIRQLAILSEVYLLGLKESTKVFAERLDLSKPVITRAVDRLCEYQLLSRVRDPHDQRRVILLKTPAGHEFFNRLQNSEQTP